MSEHLLDIKLKEIRVSFRQPGKEVQALDSINLQVDRGALVTIVGPSGCGKSTLLKVIAQLIEPTSGQVWIDEGRINQGIAYVPQAPSLLPWRTARQNACLGLELRERRNSTKLSIQETYRYVDDMFEKWRLQGFEDYYPDSLSGGMAQRIALIRSLVTRPRILLCDEPFSAIDFVTRLRLSTEFRKSCKTRLITTIVVTHNIEEAIFLGDTVVVMSGRPGRIVSNYNPRLAQSGLNAVECRALPEFGDLFQSIWQDLENHQT